MEYWKRVQPAIEWRIRWLTDPGYRAESRQSGERRASFPFASGDTFRAACHIAIECESDLAQLVSRTDSLGPCRRVFANAAMAAVLLQTLDDDIAAGIILVIHNDDVIPTADIVEHAHRFRAVHAVNWLGSREIASPLPIGVENARLAANGRMDLLADIVPANRVQPASTVRREHDLLVAFSDHTNPAERVPARKALLSSGLDASAPTRLGHKAYQRALRSHNFVASPPGNGPDCHRTWEALYAGTIPVVLRKAWAFEDRNWPVLVVEDWDEAVELLRGDNAALREHMLRASRDDFYAIDFLAPLIQC